MSKKRKAITQRLYITSALSFFTLSEVYKLPKNHSAFLFVRPNSANQRIAVVVGVEPKRSAKILSCTSVFVTSFV
jgi:hypothetical protein